MISSMETKPITREEFELHLEADKVAFRTIHEKLDLVATKKDMEQIVETFNALKSAGTIIAGGGKWGYKILITVASIVMAWLVVTGGIKAVLATIFGWAVTPK